MSDIVNIIPNIETRQKKQIIPSIKNFSSNLRLTEGSSFNTRYLNSLKRELNISLLFNDIANEIIQGKEEHAKEAAEDVLNALSGRFGTLISSKSDINTANISPIDTPNPPSYDGPPSEMVSVIESTYEVAVPQFNKTPDVIVSYEEGSDPNTTILYTESPTYVPWTSSSIKTDATGSQELTAIKVGANSFSVDSVINTDDILGQTIYLSVGSVNRERPMIVPEWSTSPNFVGYKLYRNGELLTSIIEGTTNSYEDKDISRDTLYSYSIIAIDEQFGDLEESDSISIKLDPLYQPTTLVGEYIEDGVVGGPHALLEWQSMGVPVEEVAAYRFYRDGEFITLVPSNVTSYRDRNVFAGTTHEYTVIVVYRDGTYSPQSNAVSVDIPEGVSEGIYVPRIDSVSVVDGQLRVSWGSNGNTLDVSHDIYVDRNVYYDVSGSRSIASDTVWTETYTFTPTGFVPGDEHYVMVRATRDGITSEFSEQIVINKPGPNNDIYPFVEGIQTDAINLPGTQLPSDYILDVATEYHGTQTDVTRVSVVVTGFGLTIEPFEYTRAVSAANNYRFSESLQVLDYKKEPATYNALIISATYFGSVGQTVAYRTVKTPVSDPLQDVPAGIVTKTVIEDAAILTRAWGQDVEDISLYKEIQIGQFYTTVKQEFNQADYKVVVFREPYSGPTIANNTPILVSPERYELYIEDDTDSGNYHTVFGKVGLEATFFTGSKIRFIEDASGINYTISNFYEHGTTHPYDSSYLRYILITEEEYTGNILPANTGIITT